MALVRGNEFWGRMLKAAEQQGHASTYEHIYSLDPGETTGRCRFLIGATASTPLQPAYYTDLDQLETKNVVQGYEAIRQDILSQVTMPDVIVCEDYRIYSWKSDDHKWAKLHTPQLIGAIKVLAHQLNIPLRFQLAVQAKNFCTDELLEKWGVYVKGQKHARDAQRHALYLKMMGSKPYDGPGKELLDEPG
jgi:hypothetical protein